MKLLAVFVLLSALTRSCQGRDEKSTSRVRGGIRLPSLQRRRDGQMAGSRATCRQGRLRGRHPGPRFGRGSALLFLVGGCLVDTKSFTQKVVINDRVDMLAL